MTVPHMSQTDKRRVMTHVMWELGHLADRSGGPALGGVGVAWWRGVVKLVTVTVTVRPTSDCDTPTSDNPPHDEWAPPHTLVAAPAH